jgi:membrane associated rhomboid family serine protease
MRYGTRYPRSYYSSGYFPTGVKWLLISNVVVFVLWYVGGSALRGHFGLLALVPIAVIQHFAIWQLFTYLFLHGGMLHLLFNMFSLWMFGSPLERDWGTRRFLKYYFTCGVGAGLCDITVNALIGNWSTATIGASGAIYGLLLAFGVLYPNQTVLFNFLFPIKAKYFVMIYGAMALLGSLNVNSGVSNIATIVSG